MQESEIAEGALIEEEVLPPPPPEPEKAKAVAAPIAVDQKGLMVARDNGELYRMVKVMMAGGAVPKWMDTPEKVIACWQMAASLKVPAPVAIQHMCVIQGRVCIWGELPKALAESTGELEHFEIIWIDKEQKPITLENKNLHSPVWGAVCKIKRKGRTLNEYFFTEPEAEKAKLLTKDGPWITYRKIMYGRRAATTAIKFEFGDALMGIGIAEYDFNEAPDVKDVTPSQSRDELADKLAARAAGNNQKEASDGSKVSN
jgi:hypothetical protein